MRAVLEGSVGPDYRILYIERGTVKKELSGNAYLRARLQDMVSRFVLRGEDVLPIIAMIEPVECNIVAKVPWSQLGRFDP
jgi:hypothetical protein